MNRSSSHNAAACTGLVTLFVCTFVLVASTVAAQQPPVSPARSIRNLGGPTRFTAPVRDVAAG